jgi:hypothetical protein
MKTYRILVFDYGHVNATEIVEAADDDAAVTAAREFLKTNDLEIWEGHRFVARLKPDERPSSPNATGSRFRTV